MNQPLKISLITVSYNSAKTIEQTIQSVLAQDYPFIEYIVIDGASTDGTQAIVNKYANNIAIFKSERDAGIYDAMNKGIALATGDVVGLINADDLYADNTVISQISKAFSSHNIDACYGDLIYFQDKNTEKVVRFWRSNPFTLGLFSKGWCPPHPTFFVKREIYSRHGLFNTTFRMGNDVELMMRFLEKAQISTHYLPNVLVKMRMGGVSNRGIKNILIQNKCILQAAHALNLPFSPFGFVVGKLKDRLSQFIFKPSREHDYVK